MPIRPLLLAAALILAPTLHADDGTTLQQAADARNQADYAHARALYDTLAAAGNARAEARLGQMQLAGELGSKDDAAALAHIRKAAEAGDGIGQYLLGSAYQRGNGVEKDPTSAQKWFTAAAQTLPQAAAHNDAEAQFILAILYLNGQGVGKDDAQSQQWLEKAAENGYASAQNLLGNTLLADNAQENKRAAVNWLKKAATQGHSGAQNTLGDLYKNGRGVIANPATAAEWYRQAFESSGKAAAQGAVMAQIQLAEHYYYGTGTDVDRDKAREWYQKAAAQGSDKAKQALQTLNP